MRRNTSPPTWHRPSHRVLVIAVALAAATGTTMGAHALARNSGPTSKGTASVTSSVLSTQGSNSDLIEADDQGNTQATDADEPEAPELEAPEPQDVEADPQGEDQNEQGEDQNDQGEDQNEQGDDQGAALQDGAGDLDDQGEDGSSAD